MRRSHCGFFYALVLMVLSYSAPCSAQVPTGTPPFGSFSGGPDVINLANLNAHVAVPVLNKAGRGTAFKYNLTYDSSVWYPVSGSGSLTWQPVSNWGWAGITNVMLGSASYLVAESNSCAAGNYTAYYGWYYQDGFGVIHTFPGSPGVYNNPNCGADPVTWTANDGSGYSLTVYAIPSTSPQMFQITATSKYGQKIATNLASMPGVGSVQVT